MPSSSSSLCVFHAWNSLPRWTRPDHHHHPHQFFFFFFFFFFTSFIHLSVQAVTVRVLAAAFPGEFRSPEQRRNGLSRRLASFLHDRSPEISHASPEISIFAGLKLSSSPDSSEFRSKLRYQIKALDLYISIPQSIFISIEFKVFNLIDLSSRVLEQFLKLNAI